MKTDAHPDIRPGTVPSWVIRCAYDGEEWLVLADNSDEGHACGLWSTNTGWAIVVASGFITGEHPTCGCPGTFFTNGVRQWNGNTLAEAHAAFDRIEQEWVRRHDDHA